MFNPIDILDKELYFKTPLLNKTLKQYIETYGKQCTFYVNPDHEGSENDVIEDLEHSTDIINNVESSKRTDNYTLAYGKDKVGYDYSKLQKVNAYILADYSDFYSHSVGAQDSQTFYLHVKDTPISRGDIISYKIQDKEVFYRVTEKLQSYMEILYRVQCKLIEVKKLSGGYRPYDIHNHSPNIQINPDYGVVL